MIGAGEYIFDETIEYAIHKANQTLTLQLMQKNKNIVIDETNMDIKTRYDYLWMARVWDYRKEALIMPKLSMEESVRRRIKNNHGNTPKEVWEEVYTRKESAYEKPTIKEGFNIITEIK